MRLRTTLVGLLLVIAVVLSGTIYFGFALHKQDIVAQERQEVQTAADVVATDIDSQVRSRTNLVELWSGNDALGDHGTVTQRATVSTFLEQTDFEGASVVVPNGTMVALQSRGTSTSTRDSLVGQDFSDRQYVRAALNGTTYVSPPFDAESGRRIVAISTPIRSASGIEGVFTASIHLRSGGLFDSAARLAQPNHHVVVTAGAETVFSQQPLPQGDRISTTAPVGTMNWTVAIHQSRDDIAAHLQQATLLQFGAVLLALLSVAVVGLWVSRTTIRQLDKLIDGLDDLERGSYDRDLDLSVTDEWTAISDRYNALGQTLQQRESQLQVLNRVLRHNLRNDMNVVTAHAESVLANDETPDDVAEDVEKIVATARRLIDTSEHARAFYEDLLTEGERDPKPVDAVPIVRTRVETLRAEFPECHIETDLPASAWALDTTVLPIVVEEIIHNAIVHNDRHESERTVAVSVSTLADSDLGSDGEVRIAVTDNGPGIPMVEEALLTDELEETPVEHGSGLGVWLVNWLVDQLGGTVEAHSGIERGSTVTIRVPAAPAE